MVLELVSLIVVYLENYLLVLVHDAVSMGFLTKVLEIFALQNSGSLLLANVTLTCVVAARIYTLTDLNVHVGWATELVYVRKAHRADRVDERVTIVNFLHETTFVFTL